MRFARIQYLEWARRRFEQSPPAYNLASSDMAAASAAEAGIDVSTLAIAGNNASGCPRLRRSIAEMYGVHPERVLTAAGTTQANFLMLAVLVADGDTVLCEWPVYEPLWRSVEAVGGRVRYIRREESRRFAPDVAAIAEGFAQGAKVCVLTDLHNPSATLMDRATVREIAWLAQRYDAWLIVDEVYLGGVFDRRVESAIQLDERVIVTASLTKAYGLGGLRAGWAIAPREVVERGQEVFTYLSGNSPFIADEAAVQAIAHLPQLRERSRRRREENWPLVAAFAESRGMMTAAPDGAFITWLKLPAGLQADAFVDHLLAEYETLVVPGTFFGSPDRIRLGYSAARAIVEEGLRRLGAALDELISD